MATVTVDYISRSPKPNDVSKTFCQFLYDERNACSSRMSGCDCVSSKNTFRVSRAVTDPDGEQWTIKAQTMHNQFVAEETVIVTVTGTYEYQWHAFNIYNRCVLMSTS
jgi:hypothetical protein